MQGIRIRSIPGSVGPVVLAIVSMAMIGWTWGLHTEPLIDFGREIYIAWRLSAGEVLYRDIDYFNGPVSPYFNALVFKIFGPSLLTLQIANLIEWAAICALSYRLYVAISDRLAAFVAVLVFILIFSFVQFNNAPVFNFVCPYAHEITQSLLASFGIFALLQRQLRAPTWQNLGSIGVLLGLIFLMKVEVTLAIGAASAIALAMNLRATRATPERWARSIAVVLIAAIAPLLIAWFALQFAMPIGTAFRGVLGSWKYLHDARLTDNQFYRGLTGMDHPIVNLRIMLTVLTAILIMLVPPLVLAWSMKRKTTSPQAQHLAAAGAAGYISVVMYIWWSNLHWEAAARPLNILTAITVLGFAVTIVRRRDWSPRLILQTTFALFAMLMLVKMILATSIYHYGFVLTVPAMALFTMLIVSWLPAAIERHGRSSLIFRTAAITLLVFCCIRYLDIYVVFFRSQLTEETVGETGTEIGGETMGSGADEFRVNRRATALNEIMQIFEDKAGPRDTLAVVPQGAMLNFLTQRINPTGELVLLPGEVAMFGEDRVLQRFVDHPPAWIIMPPTDVTIFGYKDFGVDYAQRIAEFIHHNYRDVTPPAWAANYPLKLLQHEPH